MFCNRKAQNMIKQTSWDSTKNYFSNDISNFEELLKKKKKKKNLASSKQPDFKIL